MSDIFMFLLGIIIGYYLCLFIQVWKSYRSRRKFRTGLLKPYRTRAKRDE